MFTKSSSTLQFATWAILASAILHLVAIFTGDGGLGVPALIGAAVFYTAVAWGFASDRRWLSYIAFIITLCGGTLATGAAFTSWGFGLIAAADFACAIFLLLHLWNKK